MPDDQVVDPNVVPAEPKEPTGVTPVEPTDPVVQGAQEIVDPVDPVVEDKSGDKEGSKPGEKPEGSTEFTPVEENVMVTEGMTYGGVEVEVDIPADLINMAGEKGVDIQAVSQELYSSEDFTLSEETLNGLYDTFGKWQVDAYLDGIKAKNDAMLGAYNAEVENTQNSMAQAWTETVELIGGEDQWDAMDEYAQTHLNEAELDEFNDVMENGSLRMQKLMIKDLHDRFRSGEPASEGHKILDLEEGSSLPSSDSMSALSRNDFLELMTSGEYQKDPEKYDQLRRLGIQKGI